MAPDIADLIAAILNDSYLVRHYHRGGRTGIGRARRTQAIQKLGLTLREALNRTEDFEAILTALVDGLHPRDEPPF